MKTKIIKVKSNGLKDTAWKENGVDVFPAYPLNVMLYTVWGKEDWHGELHLAPPTQKGYCHCIVPVWDGKEIVGPFINLSSDELMKLGKLFIKIAKKHPRNKPAKKPSNME